MPKDTARHPREEAFLSAEVWTKRGHNPNMNYVLSEYINSALDGAQYDKLEDGSYSGSISICPGVIAFADTLRDCERELRSVLEDWLLVGLKLGHVLPIIGGIDLSSG